ncbi:MAG TPA: NYN domain-containing protein, partial [Candidatus Limnocylindria bacterium]
MSKNVAVFVDVANLYYSARGQEVDVDYVALLKAATKGRDLIRAYAYSGLDPENENQRKFIDFLNKNGYKVVHKDIRKFGDGRVKANLDIELVVDMFRLAKRMDIAVVVSGDGDFAAAIRALQDEGVRCEVISFRPNTSSDLIAVADEFIDIMKIASIGRDKKTATATKGMSAPEMPAKEVVPEFGFREASPSVAAAALAAIREGKPAAAGRSARGRGRAAAESKGEPTAQPSPVAASVNGEHAEGEEGRRRRRRRGGRGRGRGVHRTEPEATTAEAGSEIGWTELDDISQIDDLGNIGPLTDDTGEEREYTFEEADEATLAELGILDGAGATAPVAPEAAEAPSEKPAPRRRTRARKPDAEAVAGDEEKPARPARRSRAKKAPETASAEVQGGDEAKPRARRSRASGAAAKSSATAAPAKDADAKPARRPRGKKADEQPAEAPADGEGGDGQGIWQRFRSARGG